MDGKLELFKRNTWEETFEKLKALGRPPPGTRTVFGPGHSGRILAEMFARLHGLRAVASPAEADLLLDDEVYTGRTYRRLKGEFPATPFWAIVWNPSRGPRRVARDAAGRALKAEGRLVWEPAFVMADEDRGLVFDPPKREFFPMKSAPRDTDGGVIAEQLMEAGRRPWAKAWGFLRGRGLAAKA